VADLVIWSIAAGDGVVDLKRCKPRRVVLNGQVVDLDDSEVRPAGRFLAAR
jgi:hypothetical protein